MFYINALIRDLYQKTKDSIENFELEGSGLRLEDIVFIDLHLYLLDPLGGRSGHPMHDISTSLQKRHVLVNVQSTQTEYCFVNAFILARNQKNQKRHDRRSVETIQV